MTTQLPSRGEMWMVDLNPTRAHERSGVRPALVVSVDTFNHGPAGLAVVLPVTSRQKGIPLHVAAVHTTEFAAPGGVVGIVPVVVVGGVVAQDDVIAEIDMDTAGAVVVGDVVLHKSVVGVYAVGAAVLGIAEIIDDETVAVGTVGRIAVGPEDVPADDDMETGFPIQCDSRPEGNAALAPGAG